MKEARDRRRGTVRLRAVLSGLAILAFLGADAAQASMEQIPFAELVRSAQLIVVGDVIDMTSELVDGGGRIETLVTIQVYDTFKGTYLGLLTVRVGGGQVGEVRMWKEDQPEFTLGTSVILFLESQGGDYAVTGQFQGKFNLLGGSVYRDGESEGTYEEFRQRVAAILAEG